MAKSVLAVLARIHGSSTCRPLETIELSVDSMERMNHEEYVDWRDIDTVLADFSIWPNLRRLAVSARKGNQAVDFPADGSRLLHDHMPRCHARGILAIMD
ncbi:hypothetical protein FB451DRAFT_1358963 [Mycena latifolia]|nr:hypothetical protein FB451DRAFT_1358963 [Mycena latifolia]